MSIEHNKLLALEFIDQVYTRGRLDIVERYVDSGVVHAGLKPGLGGVVDSISILRDAFPNMECKVVESISNEDRVVLRLAMKGSQLGSFMGLSPTRRNTKFWGIMILRFREDKIVELWSLIDIPGMLAQMRG